MKYMRIFFPLIFVLLAAVTIPSVNAAIVFAPATPSLLSPANNAVLTNSSVKLSWTTASRATAYQISISGTITTTVTVTTTSYTVTLLQGSYSWRVRAYNSAGYSSWTGTRSFTVKITVPPSPPATPTLINPANNVVLTNSTVKFSWSTSPKATLYQIQINGTTSTKVNTTSTTYTSTLNLGTYKWRVRAYNATGYSAWTSIWSFQITTPPPVVVPPIPNLLTPVNNAKLNSSSVSFTWTSSAKASSYQIQINSTVISVTTTSYSTTMSQGSYSWMVRAYNSSGYSNWTKAWSFTVAIQSPPLIKPPSAPALISPLNGAKQTNSSAKFTWSGSANATSYQLQINSTTSTIVSVTSTTYSTTLGNGTYKWNVRAYNSGGYSAWSSIWTFTVAIPYSSPPSTTLWDNCTSLSSSSVQRYWLADASQAALSIDSSVKSPLGTGSIKVAIPAVSGLWDLYVDEWWSTGASLLKDFTTGSRPTSIFVQSGTSVGVTVQVIDRSPDGNGWNTYNIAQQTIQANTMTQVQLSYSGISNSSLKMVCGISIIFRINQASFTGYISGIVASSYTSPTPAPPPKSALAWDFEDHTYDHTDMLNQTPTQIDWEITMVNTAFAQNGLPYPNQFCYPFGYFNTTTENEVAKYCESARMAWAGPNGGYNYWPVPNWYAVEALEIRRTTPLSTIEGWINTAVSTNALLCIFTHDVSENATAFQYPYGCTPEVLNATLAYLAQEQSAGKLVVLTMAQAYTYWSTAKSQPMPTVVVSFDDSHETDYTAAYPLFKEYGLAGTSYIQVNMVGLSGRLSWAEMAKMFAWS